MLEGPGGDAVALEIDLLEVFRPGSQWDGALDQDADPLRQIFL